jgi:diguanylate cyclase (GGDEF)-like protein
MRAGVRRSTRHGDAGRVLAAWPARALLGGYAVSMVGGLFSVVRGLSVPVVAAPSMILFGLVGLVLAVRCWRLGRLERRTRQAWGILSLAFLLIQVFPVLFGVFGADRFPSPGDVVRLVFTLVLFAGLVRFPVVPLGRTQRRKIGLDVATVVVGGFTVFWYLVLGPGFAATGAPARTVVAACAYPLVDLVLIFGLANILLRGADPATRRPLTLLAAGGGCFIVADVYLGYVRSHGLSIDRMDAWPILVYLTAHFLFALSAYDQYRQAAGVPAPANTAPRAPVAARLPYLAVALAYGLMLVAAAAEGQLFPWSGLVLGGVGITGVVMTRQVLVQQESHHLATTDGLTGLANRLQLYEAIDRAMSRAHRSGQAIAVVLADMNGFKAVNDTLGHKAGDQLLVQFATVLRRCVLGSDLVCRLGGDEFALVLHDIQDATNAEAVVERILADMQHPVDLGGTPVQMRASFGIAVCQPGQLGADELLHRADLAMYRAKRAGTGGLARYHPTMADERQTSPEADTGPAAGAAAAAGSLPLMG